MSRLSNILFIVLFAAVLAAGPQMINTDGDLPRHLLMGKFVLAHGFPPIKEVFVYPYNGREYVPHEWLAGVIFYLAYLILSLNGVMIVAALLISLTFYLIFLHSSKGNNEPVLTFVLVLLGAVTTSIHWLTRPHLFSMLLLGIWLIRLEQITPDKPGRIWLFPVTMLVWANLHAEYIVGFLVLLGYLAGWSWSYLAADDSAIRPKLKILAGIICLSFPASLINPSGLKAWTTIGGYLSNRYLMSRIAETQPPNLLGGGSLPLLILLLLSVLLVVLNRRQFGPKDMLLIAGFGLMSILSTRNIHLSGVALPYLLSRGLNGFKTPEALKNINRIFSKPHPTTRGIARLAAAASILASLVLAYPLRNYNQFNPRIFPANAIEWLKANPQKGRMFNAFDWGGYILFNLWPSQQVFIESQADTSGEITMEYEKVITLDQGWDELLVKYGVKWAILPPEWLLAKKLKSTGWSTIYEDDTAVILSDSR